MAADTAPGRQHDPKREDAVDKRLLLLVFGAVGCLGIALGLELFPFFGGKVRKPGRLAGGGKPPTVQQPVALPPAPRASIGFGEMIAILSARGSEPAAAAFAEAFLARPPLRALYEEYRAQGRERPAVEFVRELQASSDFAALLRSASAEPSFRALAESLARHPDLDLLLRTLRPPQGAKPKPAPDGAVADQAGAEQKGDASPASLAAPGAPLDARGRAARVERVIAEHPGGEVSGFFSALNASDRRVLLDGLEQGQGFEEACASAGLSDACAPFARRCAGDYDCSALLGIAPESSSPPSSVGSVPSPKRR